MSVLPRFGLHRPSSLGQALDLLGFDDMPLAGGTELLLAMRMRMIRPTTLVDLKRIPELQGITLDAGEVVIGGGVTHAEAAGSEIVRTHLPVLSEVLLQVGNPRVRAAGTLAGNLVFAEPKSDVIPILLALDSRLELVSQTGRRSLSVDEFILGPYWSAREPEEILTAIRIPADRVRAAAYAKYQTMERPTVGVAAAELTTSDGTRRRVVAGAVGTRPHMVDIAADEAVDAAAMAAELEIVPDATGSEDYKRHVARVYIERAVGELDAAVGR